MKWSKLKTRALSGIAATTGALALVAGMIIPASADPIIPDANEVGSLTVTKLSNPGGTLDPATGLLTAPPTDAELLAGATFKLEPVVSIGGTAVDLNTQAGWEAIAAATPAALNASILGPEVETNVTPANLTTTTDGTVVWEDLPIGLYRVTETQAPGGYVGSDPFFVTVPITHPTDLDEWVYDVHVYPKNSATGIEKTLVDEDTVQAGDTIEYTIDTDIPLLTADQTLDEFVVVDKLDPRLSLTPSDSTVLASIVEEDGTVIENLTYGTDFTVSAGLLIDFKNSISDLIANAGNKVRIQLVTTVTTDINTNRKPVVNRGILFINTPGTSITPIIPDIPVVPEDPDYPNIPVVPPTSPEDPPFPPAVPSDPVVSKFGQLEITKVDAAITTTTLTGAEFAVYLTEADALDQTNAIATSTDNADGTYSCPSLRLSNWENGAELIDDADWRPYWLVETKAPADYNLSTKPFPFYLLNEGTTYTPTDSYLGDGVVNADGVYEYVFPNAKKLTLPLTGGKGAVIFTVGGVALIAFAAVLFARSRRNESSSAN